MIRTRRGVGALEFALTTPILLLIVLGIVELSLLMHRTHVVTRAARDACRTGAGVLEGVEPTGELIEEVAEEHAVFALQAAGVTCGPGCSVDARWFEDDGWMMLRVIVSVPYQPLTRIFPMQLDTTASDFVMLTQQQVFDPE